MDNGGLSAGILADECRSAISDIKAAKPTRACAAHEPLSRGVIVLLRCAEADMARAARRESRCSLVRRWMPGVTAVIAGAGMVTWRIVRWLGP